MKITLASEKGTRSYQEDIVLFEQMPDGVLVGIFDGHGGDRTAKMASKLFKEVFPAKLLKVPTEPLLALERTFFFVSSATRDFDDGSTASVAYITKDAAYVGVLGDSPVVVRTTAGQYLQMPEHNVRSNPEEAAAAIRRGGHIQDGYLFAADSCRWRSSRGLQMARALGDRDLDSVLSRKPDTAIYTLDAAGWVLIASDGLFDPTHAVSVSAAPDSVLVKVIEAGIDAAGLVEGAIRRKTGDNASAVLVRVGESTS